MKLPMHDNDGFAFPGPADDSRINGMTLRNYFAVRAMQAQLAFEGMEGCDKELICGMAYELADAMLEARLK